MIELTGQVRVRRLTGTINIIPSESGGGGPLQAKTVYPSHSEQVIAPDEDYYGLVSVTVKAVPRVPAYETDIYFNDNEVNIVADQPDARIGVMGIEPTHYYYGGYLLPKIPEELLEQYQYAWLWYDSNNGWFDLFFSTGVWYYTSSVSGGDKLNRSVSETTPIYKHNTDSDAWELLQTSSSNWKIGSYNSGIVSWSNFDIHKNSVAGTTIFKRAETPKFSVKGDVTDVYK